MRRQHPVDRSGLSRFIYTVGGAAGEATIRRRAFILSRMSNHIPAPTPSSSSTGDLPAIGVLVLFLALLLGRLIWASPGYFLEDDIRDAFLPYVAQNFRSLLQGEFPLYNFHQYCGTPHFANGQSAALYLPIYPAALASYLVHGNVQFLTDFFSVGHLIMAGIGMFLLLRTIGSTRESALLAGMGWPLVGFNVIGAASWIFVSVFAAFLPWTLFLGIRLLQRPSFARFTLWSAVRAFYFYLGYVQFFVLGLIFEFPLLLFFALHRGFRLRRFLLLFTLSIIACAFLTAPLLFPMWNQTSISAARHQPLDYATFSSIRTIPELYALGLINPFTSFYETHLPIFDTGRFHRYSQEWCQPYLSHIGYLFLIGACFAVSGRFCRAGNLPLSPWIAPLAALFLLAFLWSTNAFGPLIYRIPVLDRFRWPFKLAVFANFFLFWIGALGVNRFFTTRNEGNRRGWLVVGILLIAGNAVAAFPPTLHRSFRNHADPLPLREPLLESFSQGRIVSVGFAAHDRETLPAMGFSYASLWGVDQFGGYDVLVPGTNQAITLNLNFHNSLAKLPLPLEYLRSWGVRWYIVAPYATAHQRWLRDNGLTVFAETPARTVFEDPRARPLVAWETGDALDGVSVRRTANALFIESNTTSARTLLLRYVFNPMFEAVLDDLPIEVAPNQLHQISVTIPPGRHRLVVKAADPWLSLGIIVLVGGLALFGFFARHPVFAGDEPISVS